MLVLSDTQKIYNNCFFCYIRYLGIRKKTVFQFVQQAYRKETKLTLLGHVMMVTKWWTLTAYPAAAYRGQLAQLEQQYSSSWRWLSLLADGCPENGYLFRTCRLNTIKMLYVLNCLKNSVKRFVPLCLCSFVSRHCHHHDP